MNTPNDAATFLHDKCATAVTRPENADHIWMIARALVKQKGAAAPLIAASQARKLLDDGDIEERLIWMRVMAASKALLVKNPRR
jgi:hypothetical protein